MTMKTKEKPESATFHDSSYLWSHHRIANPENNPTGGWESRWERHVIARVTKKFVFILDEPGIPDGEPDRDRDLHEIYLRLDRACLEDGSNSFYYTAAGRKEHERQDAAELAEALEDHRRRLDGRVCVYCNKAPAERFGRQGLGHQPCCHACHDIRWQSFMDSVSRR